MGRQAYRAFLLNEAFRALFCCISTVAYTKGEASGGRIVLLYFTVYSSMASFKGMGWDGMDLLLHHGPSEG